MVMEQYVCMIFINILFNNGASHEYEKILEFPQEFQDPSVCIQKSISRP